MHKRAMKVADLEYGEMFKADSKTDVFGGVRGTYVLDVNEKVFLSEVETLGGGIVKGYITALMNEVNRPI